MSETERRQSDEDLSGGGHKWPGFMRGWGAVTKLYEWERERLYDYSDEKVYTPNSDGNEGVHIPDGDGD